ncbi:hypothetical protein GOP47_0022343 [Adiantum capillus-veneris]|uniref:Peptidase A1 domain-containing protein n=1 Tax=Adiantum capillus-veneris TaxID=13818 RepID=A0A9D4U555_ADICA|nr:hypothetical protein GOP47_0022343 [Adiantum capillus-veneris]
MCKTTLSPSACEANNTTQPCTYVSNYISPNTSSSGTLVQDVVLLNPESGIGPRVSPNIYFGCGNLQTGIFLKGAAPNGLFGLGPEAYSVPRTLASSGVVRDVFSMCFSTVSAVGRLVFGRKPAASLQSTPLVPINPSVFYVLGLEEIVAGGVSLNVSGTVIFDTGTSLTTLPSEIIKVIGDALANKTTLKTWAFHYSESLQFSHCWNATTKAEQDSLSSLNFTFAGGGIWQIVDPLLVFIENDVNTFVCLGILPSESLDAPPIIGYNFMAMYEYYFDMENSTFSWGPSDCSGSNVTGTIEIPSISMSSPSPSPTPSSKAPSTSPTRVGETNDSSQAPSTNAPAASNAHTSSSHNVHMKFLCLLVCTIFFYSLANPNY